MKLSMETKGAPKTLQASDALKTYRYLRIGMVAAVVCLATAIAIERSKVSCWQTSISAYYYTPARAVFVGGLIAVGLALIVIKGRSNVEDMCLNFAGMFAPVVAVAPTADVGACWSIPPLARPVTADGDLAPWVKSYVDNNLQALLVAGAVGLAAAVVVAIASRRRDGLPAGARASFAVTAAALVVVWLLIDRWDDFYTRAHGAAAVLMFLFLIGAVVSKAVGDWRSPQRRFAAVYGAVAVAMAVGGVLIVMLRLGGDHTVLVLEAFEITLFAVFWVVQTIENWDETAAGDVAVI
ncbi:MAG TPA: hypothetical protein VM345_07900 [Acidimicrobiales bacterium]|nr:hypothetical protein [Acidimicrobiales bacterium]